MESHYSQSASLLEVTRAAAPTRPDQDTTGLVMDVSAVDEPSRIHAFYPPTEASFAAGADVPLIQDVQDEVQLMTGHDRVCVCLCVGDHDDLMILINGILFDSRFVQT